MAEKRPIKVYIRVRPFNDEEKEREEASALEIYKEESRVSLTYSKGIQFGGNNSKSDLGCEVT